MRKVLSFVLVLSLVLGSLGMAFAAQMPDVTGEDFEDAVNVLTDLGVVTGYPDGTYRPENIVTRAEMAVFIVNALGLSDYAAGTSSFKDMAGHWSNKYVAYATSLGIIDGYPDGTFRPDKTVSYDEAAKMLVAALGYTPDSLVGTWPANYVTKAKALKILDGIVAGSAGANRGDIATMVFQTLDCKIGTVDKNGKWEANVPVERMIDRLGGQDYKPANASVGAAFVLTNVEADAAKVNVRNYIGAYVTAYANSSNKIIGIKEVKSEFLDGKMTKDAKAFKADGVSYKIDKLDTTFAAVYLENGILVSQAAIVTADAITASVIAADVDGLYLAEVFSYNKWVVTKAQKVGTDDLDEIADGEAILGEELPLDSKDNVDYKKFDLVGVSSLDDIAKNNIVYVYVGGDYVTKVEVGTEVVKGVVSKKSAAGEYTVNGKVYEVAGAPGAAADLNVKDEVELYLDAHGDIYYAKKITGEADKYAIVLDVGLSTNALTTGKSKVELFLADGTTGVYSPDNKDLKNADFNALFNTITFGSIVVYDVNSNGDITDITNGGIVNASAGALGADFKANGTYDGWAVDADAVIFTATTIGAFDAATEAVTVAAIDDEYGVTTAAKMKGLTEVDATYFYDSSKGKITFMVVKEDSGTSDEDAVYGVYGGAGEETAADPGWIVKLLDNSDSSTKVKEYTATKKGHDDVAALTNAGLFLIKFNVDGDVSGATLASEGAIGFVKFDGTATAAGVTGVSVTVKNNVATVVASNGAVTSEGAIASKVNGTATSSALTLSSDLVVFKWNANTDKWEKKTSIPTLSKHLRDVWFFDVYGDDDKIVDIVVIF